MKIQDANGYTIPVFAVYWTDNGTIFLGMPKGYGGLHTFRLTDVKVVDPNLSGNFTFFDNGIFHSALIEERLLDDIQELDPTAYSRFLEIVKAEGMVEEDFY